MLKNSEIIPSEGLAYWVGLTQADGCLKKVIYEHKSGIVESRVAVELTVKDLCLVERFKEISQNVFDRGSGPYLLASGLWTYRLGAKTLLTVFNRLGISLKDPPTPPPWVAECGKFFGAYLAGIIDGDGNVRIKRKNYPQCMIRITSGTPQNELKEAVERILHCKAYIESKHRIAYLAKTGRFIDGRYSNLEFLVSSKNAKFVRENLLPHMTLPRKRDKIIAYLSKLEN